MLTMPPNNNKIPCNYKSSDLEVSVVNALKWHHNGLWLNKTTELRIADASKFHGDNLRLTTALSVLQFKIFRFPNVQHAYKYRYFPTYVNTVPCKSIFT